jgi:hypothetical protein
VRVVGGAGRSGGEREKGCAIRSALILFNMDDILFDGWPAR